VVVVLEVWLEADHASAFPRMYHRIKPVDGHNEQWLCNPFASIICAAWMKVVKAYDWDTGPRFPRIAEMANLNRKDKNTLWRGEGLCEIRLMPMRPQLPPEMQAGSRLGRLTPGKESA
jgi:hypothetical protein